MSDTDGTIDTLRAVRERDREHFHNPKELAAAIAIEAAELMEPHASRGGSGAGDD